MIILEGMVGFSVTWDKPVFTVSSLNTKSTASPEQTSEKTPHRTIRSVFGRVQKSMQDPHENQQAETKRQRFSF